LVAVNFKIEAKFLSESKLKQVIIQRFFTNSYLTGCILETPPLKLQLGSLLVGHHDPVVELAPGGHFLDYVGDGALFGTFLLLGSLVHVQLLHDGSIVIALKALKLREGIVGLGLGLQLSSTFFGRGWGILADETLGSLARTATSSGGWVGSRLGDDLEVLWRASFAFGKYSCWELFLNSNLLSGSKFFIIIFG
jgi:hypothetical protein